MNIDLFLENILLIGKKMIMCGTDVIRVEDTCNRIIKAYGLEVSHVYALSTLIIITVKDQNNNIYTQSCRISNYATHLGQLESLNALARKITATLPDEKTMRIMIEETDNQEDNQLVTLGYILAAFSFSIFFDGTIIDGVVSGILGYIIYLFEHNFKLKTLNKFVYTFTCCFIIGIIAKLLVTVGIGVNFDKIIIGDIMLFIPTLFMINSIKEIVNNDITTGIYRLIEVFITTFAIASGFAVSIIITRGLL